MFRAIVKDGKIEFSTAAAAMTFQQWKNANEGKRIVIKEDKEERTLSELRMYRAWLSNVSHTTGNDEEELHQFLLDKCAPRLVATIKGSKGSVEVEQVKRTSGGHRLSMDKHEMAEYMDKCAAITGYPLPTQEELAAMGYLPH